jgi:peptidoglycan/xylan/chitin deacetylase (PgdA/CDA1 family)
MILAIVIIGLTILALGYWLFMSPYSQLFGVYPWKGKTHKKIVALTFDDGPNEPYTSQILDILEHFGAKATFFQVGACVDRYPQTTKRTYEAGHVIGNHSLSHKFRHCFISLSFKDEILDNQVILQKCIGKTPALYRSPWLWRQPFLFKMLYTHGLRPVSGEFCHPLEVFKIDGSKIARSVLKRVKSGSIIIFHDGYNAKGADRTQTVKALKIVVEQLLKDGYSFVTVDKLLGVPAYQPTTKTAALKNLASTAVTR